MITASDRMRQMSRLAFALLLTLGVTEGTAFAQLEKRFAIGVAVANYQFADSDELDSDVRIIPLISRVPKPGWSLALALNWVQADADGAFVGIDGRLGQLNMRPFLGGVGYTWMWGKFALTPSLVAGPAWNRFEVDDEWKGIVGVGGGGFDDKADVWSFAIRPGVSALYAFHPRFGVNFFTGYMFNDPDFDFRTPSLEVANPWKGNGWAMSAGVLVPIF